MKVVQINATANVGSTGKIAYSIKTLLDKKGIENYIFYSLGDCEGEKLLKFGNRAYIKLQALKSRVFGNFGFNSKSITKKMLKKLDEISPDIVHLHNIHSHNVNLKLLFKFLKERTVKVVWTFHDCWAFTGYCPHYDYIKCDKWQSNCKTCELKKGFSFFSDNSEKLFKLKKELILPLDLTVVTPSFWLKEQVEKSFLKGVKTVVINNGIDLSTFSPKKSDFKKMHGIEDKFLILGVSYIWDDKKGLCDFIKLSEILDDRFKIVLVGVDKKTAKTLPKNILAIGRTESKAELAEIYSAADVFVNPTKEDTFPTVNIEALSCGTPVITYKTGGSTEIIDDTCGIAVDKGNVSGIKDAILSLVSNPKDRSDCVKRAKNFDENEKFLKYVDLYRSL